VGSTSSESSHLDVSGGGDSGHSLMNLSEFERRLAELSEDLGCSSPSTWVSIPKGVTSNEVRYPAFISRVGSKILEKKLVQVLLLWGNNSYLSGEMLFFG
jgi:hypothetical protein